MRLLLTLLVLAGCGADDVDPDDTLACPPSEHEVRRYGGPDWCLVDGALFSARAEAPIENALRDTADAVLQDHRWDSFNNRYYVRNPHGPPFDDEISDGIPGIGRSPTTTFTTEESTAPFAIYGMVMLVPDADAPQQGDGTPLILHLETLSASTSLRLVNEDGTTTQVDYAYTPLGSGPPEDISHMPLIWVEQADTPSPGTYRMDVSVSDDQNRGVSMTIPFTIE